MFYGIDIGTNSARLMLARRENGAVRSCYKRMHTVRTGEGLNASGVICEAAMERVVAALRDFRRIMDAEHPELPVFCFATSAVRDAANAEVLRERVKRETGLLIHVLSGEEEAEVGFLGAVPAGTGGILDIGGGSTEVVCGETGAICYRKSFRLGTVRCKEMFGSAEKTLQMSREAFRELAALPKTVYTGIGGTITSVAAMLAEMEVYDPQKIQGCRISYADTLALFDRLNAMSLAERRAVKGLQPERADVILYGIALLLAAMQALGQTEILVSDADNLEGYAIRYGV